MSDVSQVRFVNYAGSITKALDLIGAKDRLPQSGLIIIKPNLTNPSSPVVVVSPLFAFDLGLGLDYIALVLFSVGVGFSSVNGRYSGRLRPRRCSRIAW